MNNADLCETKLSSTVFHEYDGIISSIRGVLQDPASKSSSSTHPSSSLPSANTTNSSSGTASLQNMKSPISAAFISTTPSMENYGSQSETEFPSILDNPLPTPNSLQDFPSVTSKYSSTPRHFQNHQQPPQTTHSQLGHQHQSSGNNSSTLNSSLFQSPYPSSLNGGISTATATGISGINSSTGNASSISSGAAGKQQLMSSDKLFNNLNKIGQSETPLSLGISSTSNSAPKTNNDEIWNRICQNDPYYQKQMKKSEKIISNPSHSNAEEFSNQNNSLMVNNSSEFPRDLQTAATTQTENIPTNSLQPNQWNQSNENYNNNNNNNNRNNSNNNNNNNLPIDKQQQHGKEEQQHYYQKYHQEEQKEVHYSQNYQENHHQSHRHQHYNHNHRYNHQQYDEHHPKNFVPDNNFTSNGSHSDVGAYSSNDNSITHPPNPSMMNNFHAVPSSTRVENLIPPHSQHPSSYHLETHPPNSSQNHGLESRYYKSNQIKVEAEERIIANEGKEDRNEVQNPYSYNNTRDYYRFHHPSGHHHHHEQHPQQHQQQQQQHYHHHHHHHEQHPHSYIPPQHQNSFPPVSVNVPVNPAIPIPEVKSSTLSLASVPGQVAVPMPGTAETALIQHATSPKEVVQKTGAAILQQGGKIMESTTMTSNVKKTVKQPPITPMGGVDSEHRSGVLEQEVNMNQGMGIERGTRRESIQYERSSSRNSITHTTYGVEGDMIRLVEGFNKEIKEVQPGGKDNHNKCLPRQVVELNPSLINLPVQSLSVKVDVLGFDKNNGSKVTLGNCGHSKFFFTNGKWISAFTNIIIKYASHMNGGKLALRFTLLDAHNSELCFIDSEEFKTITKRGHLKRKIYRGGKKRKRSNADDIEDEEEDEDEDIDDIEILSITDCIPHIGLTSGLYFVKITLHIQQEQQHEQQKQHETQRFTDGNSPKPLKLSTHSQFTVNFGEKVSGEVHIVDGNVLLVQVPPNIAGKHSIRVTMDGKVLKGTKVFEYVDLKASMK